MDPFYYPGILSLFGKIWFQDCFFYEASSELIEVEVFYDGCEFLNDWHVDQLAALSNVYGAMYAKCIFKGLVESPLPSFINGVEQKLEIKSPLFSACFFDKNISFRRVRFVSDPFRDISEFNSCSCVALHSCQFENGVYFSGFSGLSSGKIKAIKCGFSGKFNAHALKVMEIRLLDCDFKGVAVFSGSKFNFFKLVRCVFYGFVDFEGSEFVDNVVFDSVAIEKLSSFRKAKFFGGLDLDRANFSSEANFLGIDADGGNIKNTTRETYRLIKHSFDKIGNHLEANKFFAKEMDKYREEVSDNKTLPWWDLAVYRVNKGVSDFGQNYLLSIGWLLLAMVFYFYAFVLHRHMGWLHTEPSCNVFGNTYDKLNCLASGMIPFKGFLTNGMELLSLVFYIIFAVLVWQTVVALKRHTRR